MKMSLEWNFPMRNILEKVKCLVATPFAFLFLFYTIDTFIHDSLIHKHSLRFISIYLFTAVGSVGCLAEIRTRARLTESQRTSN